MHRCLRFLVLLVVASGFVTSLSAQDTVQDFTSTFFPDPRITPPEGDPDPYRLDQFGSNPGSLILTDGWNGQFAHLNSAVNGQHNAISFNEVHTGDWGSGLVIEFDLRITPGNAGGADGMSVLYIPSATYGANTRTQAPAFVPAEEPNLPGTLGVGFDTWDSGAAVDGGNGAQDGDADNSISLHWDGVLVANTVLDSLAAPLAVPVLETGNVLEVVITVVPDGAGGSDVSVSVADTVAGASVLAFDAVNVPGLVPYDGRLLFEGRTGGANQDHEFDNVVLTIDGATQLTEDFETPVIEVPDVAFFQFNQDPNGAVKHPSEGGWDGQFARVASARNDQRNVMTFNQVHSGLYDELSFEFEFKISDVVGNANPGGADGFGFAYLNVANYGATNLYPAPDFVAEEPNLAGTLGVGFDTFNNAGDDGENSISVHYNGAVVANQPLDPTIIPSIETATLFRAEVFVTGDLVSVTLEDIDPASPNVGTVLPVFEDLFVDGLTSYDGRVAIGARTGGANANHDLDNVVLTVDGVQALVEDFEDPPVDPPPPPPTVRFDQYNTDPPGEVLSASLGWDGQFARIGHTVANQSNVMSFSQAYSGLYDELLLEFDFRFTPAAPFVQGTDNGADGFGIAYLNVTDYGEDTTTAVPFFSEEANLANSLGIGFDIWENGGEGLASISVHFNGALVESRPLDALPIPDLESGTPMKAEILVAGDLVSITLFDMDAFFTPDPVVVFEEFLVPGLTAYDGRLAFSARTGGANCDQDADNIRLTIDGTEVLFEDFESFDVPEPPVILPPEPSGGTPFTSVLFATPPGPEVLPTDGQLIPADGVATEKEAFLRLNDEIGNNVNITAFDQTSEFAGTINATFDLRGIEDFAGNLGRADGVSFLLIPADTYGATGADLIGNFNPMEEPNLTGAFGVGFDTFNSGAGDDNSANSVSVHWDGAIVANQALDQATEVDLVNGQFNEVNIEVYQVTGGYNATVKMTDATDGSEHTIFQDLEIPGMDFGAMGARVLFAGRTGGSADNYDIDNVLVTYSESSKPAVVSRSFLSPVYFADTATEVTIFVDDLQDVDPGFDVTIQETLPMNWTAENVSDGGSFAAGVVSWNLTGVSSDLLLTYDAVPPAGSTAPAIFAGIYDVTSGGDGPRPIGGPDTLTLVGPEIYINAGGARLDDALGTGIGDGRVWTEDSTANPSPFLTSANANTADFAFPADPVSGVETVDLQLVQDLGFTDGELSAALFSTERWNDGPIEYTVPVIPCDYEVFLLVAEGCCSDGCEDIVDPTFSFVDDGTGNPLPCRVFDVLVNDELVLDQFSQHVELHRELGSVLPNAEYGIGYAAGPFEVIDTDVIKINVEDLGGGGIPENASIKGIMIRSLDPEGCGGPVDGEIFLRGDVDGNGILEITDVVNDLAFQFLGQYTPICLDAHDFDDNGLNEITDAVNSLGHQFLGDPPPPAPGTQTCGVDPTPDGLDCAGYTEEIGCAR